MTDITLVYYGCTLIKSDIKYNFIKVYKDESDRMSVSRENIKYMFNKDVYNVIGITYDDINRGKDFIVNNNYPVYNNNSRELLCDTLTIIARLNIDEEKYYRIAGYDYKIIDINVKLLEYYNNTIGISNMSSIDVLPCIDINDNYKEELLNYKLKLLDVYTHTLLIDNDNDSIIIDNSESYGIHNTTRDRTCKKIKFLANTNNLIIINTLKLVRIDNYIKNTFTLDCKDTKVKIKKLIIEENIEFTIIEENNLEIEEILFNPNYHTVINNLNCKLSRGMNNISHYNVTIEKSFNNLTYIDSMYIEGVYLIKDSFSCCNINKLKFKDMTTIEGSFKAGIVQKLIIREVGYITEGSFNESLIDEMDLNESYDLHINESFQGISTSKIDIENSLISIIKSFNNICTLEFVKLTCYMTNFSFCNCKLLKELKLSGTIHNSFTGNNIHEYTLGNEYLRLSGKFCNKDMVFNCSSGILGQQLQNIGEENITVTNVKEIGDFAFSNNYLSITNLDLGNDIEYIGNSAIGFNKRDLNLWDWVKIRHISKNAFASCEISNLILPQNLEELPENVFMGCTYFENIVIPKSVIKIHKNIFDDKAIKHYNKDHQPNIYVFRESEAYKFFKRKRMNMIVIDSIDEALSQIFGINNRSLIKAKMLLSNIDKYKDIIDDSRYKNSLHIIYKLDTFLNEDIQEDSKYYPLNEVLNINIENILKLNERYKEECKSYILDSRIDVFERERMSLWTFIIMQKSLCIKQFSNQIYNNLNEYYTCISKALIYHDPNKYSMYQEIYNIGTNSRHEVFTMKVLYILNQDRIIYITFVNRSHDHIINSDFIKKYGLQNVFDIIEQQMNYRMMKNDNTINVNQRRSCIFNILKEGDILSGNTDVQTKIDNKLMPYKYNDGIIKEFLRQHIILLVEPNLLKKYDDGNDTITYAWFVNILNCKVVYAKIKVSGTLSERCFGIIYIEINKIITGIPEELINRLKELTFNNKCMHVYSRIVFRDSYIEKLKANKFAYDTDPIDEIILANKIIKHGIFKVSDLTKDIFNEILDSSFAIKVKNISRLDEFTARSDINTYIVDDLEVREYKIHSYPKAMKLKKLFESEVIIEVRTNKRVSTYQLIISIPELLNALTQIGIGYDTKNFKSDGYSINDKTTSIDEYIILSELYSYRNAMLCVHKNSKMVYMIASSYDNTKQILRFKSLKSAVDYAIYMHLDRDNRQFNWLYNTIYNVCREPENIRNNELTEFRKMIIDGLPNGVWISDNLDQLNEYIAKQPKKSNN